MDRCIQKEKESKTGVNPEDQDRSRAMIKKIEFFTAGCPRSQISEKNLRKALGKLGLKVEVESIDDPKVHEARGVAAFSAVMIDDH